MAMRSILAAFAMMAMVSPTLAQTVQSPQNAAPPQDIFTEDQEPIVLDIVKINACMATMIAVGKLQHMETAILANLGLASEKYLKNYVHEVKKTSAKFEFFHELEQNKSEQLRESGMDEELIEHLSRISFLESLGRVNALMFEMSSGPAEFNDFMEGVANHEKNCDRIAGEIS